MKRWLYLVHRWIGVSACVVMALWFFSGVVMLYVGYPKLTALERLQHLPALDLDGCCAVSLVSIGEGGAKDRPDELRLAMVAGEPTWLARSGRDRWTALRARDGAPFAAGDSAAAMRSAVAFAQGTPVRELGLVREDAFTHSKALDPHRPLRLFALEDEPGTQIYVSSRTGEVVRDSTSLERGWNWVGAWLHWLYMFRGNAFDPAWHDIVVWSSLIATVGSLAGLWVGVLRWRFKKAYKTGQHTPYREPWMRWHHILGLAFSVATIAWIFSGLMSMNPWKVFSSAGKPTDLAAYAGGKLEPSAFALSPAQALAAMRTELGEVKELQYVWFEGKPWYVAYNGAGRTRVMQAVPGAQPAAMFDEEAILRAAGRLLPGASIARSERLTDYDNWYLQRAPHTMSGHIERRLPVWRVEFDDARRTMFHVDPHTAAVTGRIDEAGRWKRWLFAALHSWDLRGLVDRRPLWDILMIAFSAGGFALCVTSVVIAWRRLRRKFGSGQGASAPSAVLRGDARA
jgi:uncharacterized iron-regulated membrane protein